MPTPMPQRPERRIKAVDRLETVDWLALWAVSLGLSAIVLAAIAYFTADDNTGASFILASAAGIIGAALYGSRQPTHE